MVLFEMIMQRDGEGERFSRAGIVDTSFREFTLVRRIYLQSQLYMCEMFGSEIA